MIGVHVELLEVRHVRLDQLDVRESHHHVVGHGDPQTAIVLRVPQVPIGGDLVEHRLRGMPDE
jgi:hypothetical protein